MQNTQTQVEILGYLAANGPTSASELHRASIGESDLGFGYTLAMIESLSINRYIRMTGKNDPTGSSVYEITPAGRHSID